MSKRLRMVLLVVVALAVISTLHVWLNIGFDKLGFGGSQEVADASFRVGFLPVT